MSDLADGVLKVRAHAESLLSDVDETWALEELLRMLGSERVAPLLDPEAFVITDALNAAIQCGRTVSTVAELDALDDGSVVLSDSIAYQKERGTAWDGVGRGWDSGQIDLPATVIYLPNEKAGTE